MTSTAWETIETLNNEIHELQTLLQKATASIAEHSHRNNLLAEENRQLRDAYENRYPTEWAYNQACKALESWHAECTRLKEENAQLREAAEEVIRISDRKHDAWDRLKEAIRK